MSKLYKLHNQIKHYEWGSKYLLPQFLGIECKNSCAELWMGTHSGAPSQTELDEKTVKLKQVSGELPFLFKLLAVEKPLSIQAHPNKEQAEKGFAQEEAAGLSLRAPTRNYKDSNHKPEIICAITPFKLMAGFRKFEEIRSLLDEFSQMLPPLKEIISPLIRSLNTDTLAVFFRILLNFSQLEREYLTTFITKKNMDDIGEVITLEQWQLMKKFALQYPNDPAVISPIYMNLITLQPGQAISVPAGVLHAYISGFGIELMSASDNVLRGGLTPKHIDIPGLMSIVKFYPFLPAVSSPDSPWFVYPSPCNEFQLAYLHGDGSERTFDKKAPAICIVTEGELLADGMKFKKGESFFIPAQEGLSFSGNYSLFAALTGDADTCAAGAV